eukprot:3719904-Pyramimonas_sp.AAC.1
MVERFGREEAAKERNRRTSVNPVKEREMEKVQRRSQYAQHTQNIMGSRTHRCSDSDPTMVPVLEP